MAHLYYEYGGGLGDVVSRMAIGCGFNVLNKMTPEDTAEVVVISHNPHSREFFDYHPKASQIKVRAFDYWHPSEDRKMRARYSLPYPAPREIPTCDDKILEFFPAEIDKEPIAKIKGRPYVVFSVSANDQVRHLPYPLARKLIMRCLDLDLLPVFVGKTYMARFVGKPHEHFEIHPEHVESLDLIDKLTVPGVAYLIQGAFAAINCYSAGAVMSWALKKRQLLLYPEGIRKIIDNNEPRLEIETYRGCMHTCFQDVQSHEVIENFFSNLANLKNEGERPGQMEVSS